MFPSHRPASDTERAVSPVVGVVLLVGLATLLGATVGAFALGVQPLDTPPRVATTSDELTAYDPADGDREQRLRLVHEGGPPVEVASLELVVRVPRTGARVRLDGFPVSANKLDRRNVEGGTFVDLSHGETVGSLSRAPPDTDGVWSAGETLGLRITSGDVRLRPGDRVVVRVVDEQGGQTVASETFVAS